MKVTAELLCCTPETNVILYINFISARKRRGKPFSFHRGDKVYWCIFQILSQTSEEISFPEATRIPKYTQLPKMLFSLQTPWTIPSKHFQCVTVGNLKLALVLLSIRYIPPVCRVTFQGPSACWPLRARLALWHWKTPREFLLTPMSLFPARFLCRCRGNTKCRHHHGLLNRDAQSHSRQAKA